MSSSKAAASEGPEAYPLGYVEGLNDARTPLADFFSILLGKVERNRYQARLEFRKQSFRL